MGASDKWKDLPDVVAQLQAEAKMGASPRRTPGAAARRPPAEAPAGHDDQDETVIRIREVPDNDFVEFTPPPQPERRTARNGRPAPSPPAVAAVADEPARSAIDWGGLDDYEALAADPRPDLRALGARLIAECERTLGGRSGALRPLLEQLCRDLDELLADGGAGDVAAERRRLLFYALDRIEDILTTLVVNR